LLVLVALAAICMPHSVGAQGLVSTRATAQTASVVLPGQVSVPHDIISSGANDVLTSIDDQAAKAAGWVLTEMSRLALGPGTEPDLTQNNSWFWDHFRAILWIAGLVTLPLLLAACALAALKGDAAIAVKAGFVMVPAAFIGTVLFIHVAQMLIQISDGLSQMVGSGTQANFMKFAADLSATLTNHDKASAKFIEPFVVLIGSILIILFGLLLYIELLVREASIYAVAVFTPLMFASLVFPGAERIAKKGLRILVALIFAKFVIVAMLSLGIAALGDAAHSKTGLSAVGSGLVIIIMATVVPNVFIQWTSISGLSTAIFSPIAAGRAALAPSTSSSIYAGIRRGTESRLTSFRPAGPRPPIGPSPPTGPHPPIGPGPPGGPRPPTGVPPPPGPGGPVGGRARGPAVGTVTGRVSRPTGVPAISASRVPPPASAPSGSGGVATGRSGQASAGNSGGPISPLASSPRSPIGGMTDV